MNKNFENPEENAEKTQKVKKIKRIEQKIKKQRLIEERKNFLSKEEKKNPKNWTL